ncbi:MAG: hypothetical protein Q8P93_02375 [bacterium]|nr:hypothetical protein [bacterium]
MKTRTDRYIVLAGILAGTLALLFVGAYLYGYRTYTALVEVADEYSTLRAKEEYVVALRVLSRETQEEWSDLSEYIVRRSEIVSYIEDVERIADNAGLTSAVRTVASDADDVLTLRLEVSGAFSRIMHLVYRLETLPYVAYINALDFEHNQDDEWAAYIELVAPAYINDQP